MTYRLYFFKLERVQRPQSNSKPTQFNRLLTFIVVDYYFHHPLNTRANTLSNKIIIKLCSHNRSPEAAFLNPHLRRNLNCNKQGSGGGGDGKAATQAAVFKVQTIKF